MKGWVYGLGLVLTGCAAPPPAIVNPPAYEEGRADGCQSGRAAAGRFDARHRKDAARFQADALYADGWTDGFNECKGDAEAVDRMLGPVF
jgi:hypothetical protein